MGRGTFFPAVVQPVSGAPAGIGAARKAKHGPSGGAPPIIVDGVRYRVLRLEGGSGLRFPLRSDAGELFRRSTRVTHKPRSQGRAARAEAHHRHVSRLRPLRDARGDVVGAWVASRAW